MPYGNHVCKICGRPFVGPIGQKYCSNYCRVRGRAQLRAADNARGKAKRTANRKKKNCPTCGMEFMPKNANQKYCGYECYPANRKRTTAYRNKGDMMPAEYYRCGRPEFLLLDSTLATLKQSGKTYAERQISNTLAKLPKIDVKGFMEAMKGNEDD